MLALLLSLSTALAWDVRINEVLYDPTGADAGGEWVELCNSGSSAVDLTGWTIESAGSSWATSWTFSAGTISAGGLLLVGSSLSSTHPGTFTPNLQNGGSASDGIRLKDSSGNVVDTLLYDEPNTAALADDSGGAGTSLAAAVASAHSLGRIADCGDTDASAVDFADFAVPTPGASNGGVDTGDSGGGATCSYDGSDIVINEFLSNPSGTDTNAEWVELYNAGSATADLSGWWIEAGGSSWTDGTAFPEGTTLAPGDWLLVGGSLVGGAEQVLGVTLGNASSNSDALRLMACDSTVVDVVVYGSPNTDGWTDESGVVATSLAAAATEGTSLERPVDGADTNQSGVDFAASDVNSPDGTNESGVVVSCESSEDVKINELMPNPSGTDSAHEWVELYNAGLTSVDLSGWWLAAASSATSGFSEDDAFAEGTVLAPGDWLLVGGSMVSGAELSLGITLGNDVTNADALRLVDCNGDVMDTVIWGGANTEGWTDDLGAAPSLIAPAPVEGSSLERLVDGVDSEVLSDDFAVADYNSPDQTNAYVPGACTGNGQIQINELLPNPSGTDSGSEWVELYNSGSSAVDLSGWWLEAGTSASGGYSADDLFPEGTTLAPGEWLLIGQADVVGAELSLGVTLGNDTTNADALRLVDCNGLTADTVIWGGANTEGWLDDLGMVAAAIAPVPVEGASLERVEDGLDTEDLSLDFAVADYNSPGLSNAYIPDACAGSSAIKINEFMPNPEEPEGGDEADYEWVELYNSSGAAVDLSGWTLQAGTSNYSSDEPLPVGTTLGPGEWLLIGGAAVEGAIAPLGVSMGTGSSGDGLRLLDCNGLVADTVIYGADNEDGWADDSGAPASSLAPAAVAGQSIERVVDGEDSDQSGVDFALADFASPGFTNSYEPPPCEGNAFIKINEVMINPSTPDADTGEPAAEEDHVWLELYNSGSSPVELSGWQLEWGTSGWSSSTPDGALDGAVVPAGGFLVLGGAAVPSADVLLDADFGNATSSADAIRIVDCNGLPADTLIYGDPNSDAWVGDDGAVASSMAPTVGEDETLGRCGDGLDSDQCGEDFGPMSAATPGGANADCPVCEPGQGGVLINEFLPDPDGTDADNEWVELLNSGEQAVRLDGWVIESGASSWDACYEFPANSELAPGERLLIGGDEVPTDHKFDESSPLGNASSAPDGLRIVDCEGTVQDTVLYGDVGDEVVDTEMTDDLGNTTFAPMPGEARSLGRCAEGADSNDSSVDFGEQEPSPEAANNPCGGTGDGGDGDGNEGELGGKSGCTKDSTGGCSTGAPQVSLMALGLALAALRRRSRGR
jgi:Lamin Tail Domain